MRVGLLVVLATLALPAAAEAGARAAYVAVGTPDSPGTIAQFSVAVPGGMPAPLNPPSVPTGQDPQHIAVTADGRFAYATAAAKGEVWAYAVGTDGGLSPLGTAPAEPGTHGIAVTPDDHSVYAANQSTGSVSQYDVQSDGTLAPKTPPAVPAEAGASGVAIAPDGRSVYVTNLNAGTVSQYDVSRSTGALTPKSPPTVGAPPLPSGLGTSPGNLFDTNLYVASLSGRLAQYVVDDKTGMLSPLQPASVSVGTGSAGVASDPDGQNVYTPDAGAGSISQFERDLSGEPVTEQPSGLLTPLTPPSVPAGTQPEGIAVTPSGRAVYAADGASAALVWLARDGKTGRLSAGEPATLPAGAGPHGVVVTPDQGPFVHFHAPRVVHVGQRVRFDARPTADPDGTIKYWFWDLGDGPLFDVRRIPHFKATRRPVLTYRYRKPGRYLADVVAIDDEGCSFDLSYTGQTAFCNPAERAAGGQRITVRP
jgi:DNA-binding beta-propeller fold protein YncE